MAEARRLAALWQSHMSAGVRSQELGRYVRAEKQFRAAIGCAERLKAESWRLGTSLAHMADIYRAQGKSREAESICYRALSILHESNDVAPGALVFALQVMACLRKEQGLHGEACELYHRALATAQASGDAWSLLSITSLRGLAELCQAQGHYGSAEGYCIQALQLAEPACNRGQVEACRIRLASIYVDMGSYGAAKALCDQAMGSIVSELGPEHPLVAEALDIIGLAHLAQGDCLKAAACFRGALSLLEQQPSPRHPRIGLVLNHLADSFVAQSRYAEAEALYGCALSLQDTLGPRHPDVSATLDKLGIVCSLRGEHQRAEAFFHRAQVGRKMPSCPNNSQIIADGRDST